MPTYTINNFPGNNTTSSPIQTELLLAVLNAVSSQTIVGENSDELAQELTIVGGAYTAKNAVVPSLGTLSFQFDASNGYVVQIRAVRLYTDDTVNAPQYRIHWFNTPPPAQTDKLAYSANYAQAIAGKRKRHTMPVMANDNGHGFSEDISNWIEIKAGDADNKIYFQLQTLTAGNIAANAKLTIVVDFALKTIQ